MEQNNRAVLLPRLQIKPHTGPLLRQLLQDGCRISRQTARKNSCPTSRERETVGAAANIWPQARRPSRTGAEGPDRRSGRLQPRRDSRGCFGTKSSRGEKKKKTSVKEIFTVTVWANVSQQVCYFYTKAAVMASCLHTPITSKSH